MIRYINYYIVKRIVQSTYEYNSIGASQKTDVVTEQISNRILTIK